MYIYIYRYIYTYIELLVLVSDPCKHAQSVTQSVTLFYTCVCISSTRIGLFPYLYVFKYIYLFGSMNRTVLSLFVHV